MARLINAEKMGFFATPPQIVERIVPWLLAPQGDVTTAPAQRPPATFWRALDPCAGEGAALAQLTAALGGNVVTWGAELSPQRAALAAQVLDKVHPTAWQSTRITAESASLVYLNPPYDYDLDATALSPTASPSAAPGGRSKRLEIEFLRTTLPALLTGGILVYIIPQHILRYPDLARLLAGHFADLTARRFPDGAYERFKQVVVFGRRRKYASPDKAALGTIQAWATATLLPLEAPERVYPLPPAPSRARFYRVDLSDAERVHLACERPWPADLLAAMQPGAGLSMTPPLPLKKGHVAMLMSSGLMGTLSLHKEGQPLLVKGRVLKVQDVTEEHVNGSTVTVHKDRFVTQVGVITPDEVQVIEDVADLTLFMERYGEEIAAEILKHPPRYDLQPTPDEWAHMGRLGLQRPPLPGQSAPGLLPVQKHLAIALARTLAAQHHALIQGEMGVGKTTVGLATLDALNAYPAIIIAPPQLVTKWAREARDVIPGVQVRELQRLGYAGNIGHDVNDARQFAEDWHAGRLGAKAIAVIAETSAKLGAGWAGQPATRYLLPAANSAAGLAQRAAFREAIQRYHAARAALQALRHAGEDATALATQRAEVAELRQAALALAVPVPVCPRCGTVQHDKHGPILDPQAFDKRPHTCNTPLSGWQRDSQGCRVHDTAGRPGWQWLSHPPERPCWLGVDDADDVHTLAPRCGGRLYQFGAQQRRWPLADYIRRKHRGLFKLLIAEEVHEYRSRGSDRAAAFRHLITATRDHLGMTGTVYGGKSTSVFYLFYWLFPQVRAEFGYTDEKKWAQRYGVLETRRYGKGTIDAEDNFGSFNATRRGRTTVIEKPGVSPAIMRQIVDTAAFVALKDLGIGLPPYHEDRVAVTMTAEQAAQYREMESALRAQAQQHPRWLATWLQWSLSRPNSAFRTETVTKVLKDAPGHIIEQEDFSLALPAIVAGVDPASGAADPAAGTPNGRDPLPKEQWLVDYAKAEKAAGRKVLVYVRQTATRDIQPRLKAVLAAAGLRAGVLYGNVSTRKRETWINRHSPALDVLLCNPKLVQTGLDLVMFSTIVFFEIDYDLFVLWQAMRRVWRLGQTQPVKVIFTVYAHTLEDTALRLIGKKMKAAQLLYGDSVGGAIVPDDGENFLTELARTVLEDRDLPDLQALFAASDQVTQSALGSPTAQSPLLRPTMTKLWQQVLAGDLVVQPRRPRRASSPVSDAQPALFTLG